MSADITTGNSISGLTVLRTLVRKATKTWRFDKIKKNWTRISTYDGAKWFHPIEYRISCQEDLARVLTHYQHDPLAFIIRGALTPATAAALAADPDLKIRRLKARDAKTNEGPFIVEVDRRWLMVDFDQTPLPDWADLVNDPEAVVDYAVRNLLPPAFHQASYFWQLSSSAGFVLSTLKLHLFFWLSAPASSEHVKAVMKQVAPEACESPYETVQPHYIAGPIILGGADPLPRRTGWHEGLTTEVDLPVLVVPPSHPPAPGPYPPRPSGGGFIGSSSVSEALGQIGDDDGHNGCQGFHGPVTMAAWWYAVECEATGERDDATFKDEARKALRAAPGYDSIVEVTHCKDKYLQDSINGAFRRLALNNEIPPMEPDFGPHTQTLKEGQAALQRHIRAFLERAVVWNLRDEEGRKANPPEHAALGVGVGVGKSFTVRAELQWLLSVLADGKQNRALLLAPTHRLKNETLTAMLSGGINAAEFRGREAPRPDGDGAMCMNLDAVKDAMVIGASVETAVCGSATGRCCPFRSECAYQAQKAVCAAADVVIASHQNLFRQLPREVRQNFAAVIVDEGWWQTGLDGAVLDLSAFADEPKRFPVLDRQLTVDGQPSVSPTDTANLCELSEKAHALFAGTPEGCFVSKADAQRAGLTVIACAAAYRLEWRRKVEGLIYPGQPKEERRSRLYKAAGNAGIYPRACVWRALQELLEGTESHTGRLAMGARSTDGGTVRTIILRTRRDALTELEGLPILLLDATLPVQIVRYFLPRLDVLDDVQPAAPHMRVHQILGGWGKSSIIPSSKTDDSENRTRKNKITAIQNFIKMNSGGNGLVITYKPLESYFAAIPGVRAEHFNNVAGVDTYRNVASLFTIGLALPSPEALREAAIALTGRPIAGENGHWETRAALMADGTGAGVKVRVYSDPDMEAIRAAIADQKIQEIGRGRGVMRTAENPLTVYVFANTVLPLPLATLTRWKDAKPDVVGLMLARNGVLWSPVDAAKAYPDLFISPDAAKKAIQRCKDEHGDILLRKRFIGECPRAQLLEIAYRPKSQGSKTRTAHVTTSQSSDFRPWLEGIVGPLAHYEVHEELERPMSSAEDEADNDLSDFGLNGTNNQPVPMSYLPS